MDILNLISLSFFYFLPHRRNLQGLCEISNEFYSVQFPSERILGWDRNSRPEVFCKKCVLRDFAKFTGKHLYQRLFFNKVAGLEACNFIKKETLAQVFPVNLAKFLRAAFLQNTSGWLLLTGEDVDLTWLHSILLKKILEERKKQIQVFSNGLVLLFSKVDTE